jgi:uncharacterized SAM-binding protein YcdF (DUF218 family)
MSADVIITLGFRNDAQGRLHPLTLGRLQAAATQWRQRPGARLILTGGFGPHFNTAPRSHAWYCRGHLFAQGIPADAVAALIDSTNTIEDAVLSRPQVLPLTPQRLVLVTSDFHMPRARLIFERVFPGHAFIFVAAPSERIHAAHLFREEAEKLRLLLDGGLPE